MTYVECGATDHERAEGWRAYRTELTVEAELEDPKTPYVPAVVFYCPTCAVREFGDS